MKFKLSLIAGLVSVLASLSLVAGAGAASKAKHKCNLTATEQTSGKASGYDFGTQKCSSPYGAGIAYITYTQGASAAGVTETGTFKLYFNRGTLHGSYALAGHLATPGTPISVAGKFKVLGGTAAFAGKKATGKMTCTTSDVGAHFTCVAQF